MNKQEREAYAMLRKRRRNLTRQQIRTLKGQIITGDAEGALRGIRRIIAENTKEDAHERQH
jgi:hypothetical protein